MKNLKFVWWNRQRIPLGWKILLLVLALAAAIGFVGALYFWTRSATPTTTSDGIDNILALVSFIIIGIAHGGLLVYAVLHDTPDIIRSGEGEWKYRERH